MISDLSQAGGPIISIVGLRLTTCIGVPDEERSQTQTVLCDVHIHPGREFHEMNDEIGATIDYAAVAERLHMVAKSHPRRLIETLCSDFATMIIEEFSAAQVRVEIRKFILPNAEYVAVSSIFRADGASNI